MEVCLWNYGYGAMVVELWLWNYGCGAMVVELQVKDSDIYGFIFADLYLRSYILKMVIFAKLQITSQKFNPFFLSHASENSYTSPRSRLYNSFFTILPLCG